ncbi:MAG: glycosyltransferase family 4 protein [Chloroflexota bacterium]
MRLLHLIHRYRPAHGGAENYMDGISSRLAASGHDVTVITTDIHDFERLWDPSKKRFESLHDEINGVVVQRFPVEYLPLPTLSFPALRHGTRLLSKLTTRSALSMPLAHLTPRLPALAEWIATTDEKFDLIAGTTITLEGIVDYGRQFAQRLEVPFVVYPLTHLGAGLEPGSDRLSRFYTMPHQKELVLAADGVIGITQTEIDYYVAQGKSPDSTAVAPPGIDINQLSGGRREVWRNKLQIEGPLIISVAAMAPAKGTLHTIQACAQLWKDGLAFDLALAGTVTAPFKKGFAQLPDWVQDRVHLLGPISEGEKRDLLAAADIFCMPSQTESFGIAYLEAWFYRLPVIGAETWGVKGDVIHAEQEGLLVPFGDVDALRKALMRLIYDGEARKRMGIAGYQKLMSTYNWDRSIGKIAAFYTHLIQSYKQSGPLGQTALI